MVDIYIYKLFVNPSNAYKSYGLDKKFQIDAQTPNSHFGDYDKRTARGLEKMRFEIPTMLPQSPIKGHHCFLEQEILPLLLSTGWFQEQRRA